VLASVALFAAMGNTSTNPVVQTIHDSPGYATWIKISIVLGIFVGVVLLAAGIGLLKLKPWARKLSIAYGIYAIVMILIGMVVNYLFLTQPMLEQAHQKQGPDATVATGAAIGGIIGGMFGSCFGIVYPILLLIFMTRPKVVAAFHPLAVADVQQ
jgi:multidrug transporter EmrE-like cation transporter